MSLVVKQLETENKLNMKTIYLLVLSAAVLLFANTGCVDDFLVRGNGIQDSEARFTPPFSTVISEGNFEVHITSGQTYEVMIQAESNLLPYIETSVNGSKLRIHTRGLINLRNRLPIEVFVTVPYIDGLVQSGSGIITTGFFEGDNFNFVVSGSGSVETAVEAVKIDGVVSGSGLLLISGNTRNAELIVSGSGEIDAWDLTMRDCNAKISGSGDIWVYVERNLRAIISGSGNVFYSGSPNVDSTISGSGRIIRKN